MSKSSAFSLEVDYPATNTYIAFSFILAALSVVPVGLQFKHNQAGPASLGSWMLLKNLVDGVSLLSCGTACALLMTARS